MRKVIASEYMSLDGVTQAPELLAGYLGRIGRGRLLTHGEELDLGRRVTAGDARARNGTVGIHVPATGRRPTKEARVKIPSHTMSRPRHIVCPACGSGELRPREPAVPLDIGRV